MNVLQDISSIFIILNILLALAVIFLERKDARATWAWLMVLYFLPGVGFVLYLIIGQRLRKRKLNKMLVESQRIIEDSIEAQKLQLEERHIAFNDPATINYQTMIHMNLVGSYSLYTQNNAVQIFTTGKSKFDTLLQDIESAQHHIHLVYYIVRNDKLGNRLIQALVEKAKQGVQVRFLYDHIGSKGLPRKFFKELREAGGQAVAFFPSRIPYLNLKINFRNHRKLVIVDGRIGYIGGFNIGDEYLGRNKYFGEWRDTHLRLEGRAVLQIQAQFLMDWNLAFSGMVELDYHYFPRHFQAVGAIGMQVVASGPDSDYQQIKDAYIKMIYSAKRSICLQTPYFVPDESLMTALKIAAMSGVEVKVMLPSKPDHFFVYWATHSYLNELLAAGGKCYIYERGFLHAKTLVIDGQVASVGTANIDNRSFKLNFEMNAFIYDSATASELERLFGIDLEECTELTYDKYLKRPLMDKFKESIARLLSPIL